MDAQAFLTRGAQVIIRMRGLPYDCTAKQVIEFFELGENPCNVMDGEEGVLFVKKPDGRATGDAFVLFAQEDDSPKALSKHRELIGTRYIELFRSTTAEVQQVLNRSMDPKTFETPLPVPLTQISQLPLVPQHYITSGTRKDCIRLRGLPYEAQVEHILEFLGEHAKNIVFQGVHMVYNAQGQPSGEAFIQMTCENTAFSAAQQRHHRYMVFGKKQRYIEVFQCSGEDMNLVLTGGAVSPVAKALLSPGMLSSPPPPTTPAPPPPVPVAATVPPAQTFDPLVAAAMQAQAIAQLRQNQESVWLMNQIAMAQAAAAQQQQQQQQQALALALSAKQPQTWADYMGAIPPPSHVVVSSAASTPVTSKPHMSFPTAQFLPTTAHTPYFVLNIPPRIPPPAYYSKVPQVPPPQIAQYAPYSQMSFMPQAHAATAPNPPQPLVNLKRSWEHAFPAVGTNDAASAAKRQFPPLPNSTQPFPPTNLPPPPPNSQVSYQPPQFYAGL